MNVITQEKQLYHLLFEHLRHIQFQKSTKNQTSTKLKELTFLESAMKKFQNSFKEAKEKVDSCIAEIKDLKSQLKDGRKDADQVNTYLNNYFGHKSLNLVAVDEESENGKFKFEIQLLSLKYPNSNKSEKKNRGISC